MKTETMRSTLLAAMMAAMTAAMMMGLPVASAQTPAAAEQLQEMARAADSAGEHAEVAKQYRLRAESLDAEATKHEDEAKKLARSAGAMIYKWPAMASGHQRAKEKAVQTRRAAAESRKLADHHVRLSVEAQAIPAN